LRGFVDLTLSPPRITLKECSVHEQNGRRWIGLPGRPQIDLDGRHRVDSVTGKKLYMPTVEIPDRDARERFQEAALAAVDRLLGHEGAA
jgi:hypothetical protein